MSGPSLYKKKPQHQAQTLHFPQLSWMLVLYKCCKVKVLTNTYLHIEPSQLVEIGLVPCHCKTESTVEYPPSFSATIRFPEPM